MSSQSSFILHNWPLVIPRVLWWCWPYNCASKFLDTLRSYGLLASKPHTTTCFVQQPSRFGHTWSITSLYLCQCCSLSALPDLLFICQTPIDCLFLRSGMFSLLNLLFLFTLCTSPFLSFSDGQYFAVGEMETVFLSVFFTPHTILPCIYIFTYQFLSFTLEAPGWIPFFCSCSLSI